MYIHKYTYLTFPQRTLTAFADGFLELECVGRLALTDGCFILGRFVLSKKDIKSSCLFDEKNKDVNNLIIHISG